MRARHVLQAITGLTEVQQRVELWQRARPQVHDRGAIAAEGTAQTFEDRCSEGRLAAPIRPQEGHDAAARAPERPQSGGMQEACEADQAHQRSAQAGAQPQAAPQVAYVTLDLRVGSGQAAHPTRQAARSGQGGRAPVQAGDSVVINGLNIDGATVNTTLAVDGTTTVQDLLDQINAVYNTGATGATATIDNSGNISLTANTTGPGTLTLTLSDAVGNTGATTFSNFFLSLLFFLKSK